MRRRRLHADNTDDSTALAGWMYADFLLGLMVVFLATVSFRPVENFSSKSTVKATSKQVSSGYNFYKGVTLIYNGFNKVALDNDIAAFKTQSGLDKNSEIIFAQILGGYDATTENVDAGRNRALLFSFELETQEKAAFSRAGVAAGGISTIKPGQIALRLSFAAAVGNTSKAQTK